MTATATPGDLAKADAGATLRHVAGDLLTRARGTTSRRALAERLDVSDVTLLGLETGRDNPTLNRLAGIAVDYGVNLRLVDVDMVAELRFALERHLGELTGRTPAVTRARTLLEGAIAGLDLVDTATAAPASQAPEWADIAAANLAAQPQPR